MRVTVRCCDGNLIAAQVLNVVGSQVMLSSRMEADDKAWMTWWIDMDDLHPLFAEVVMPQVIPLDEHMKRLRALTATDIAVLAASPRDAYAVNAANEVLASRHCQL